MKDDLGYIVPNSSEDVHEERNVLKLNELYPDLWPEK